MGGTTTGTIGTQPYSTQAMRAPSDLLGVANTLDGSAAAYGRQSPMVANGVSPGITNVHATGLPDIRGQDGQLHGAPQQKSGGLWSVLTCRCG